MVIGTARRNGGGRRPAAPAVRGAAGAAVGALLVTGLASPARAADSPWTRVSAPDAPASAALDAISARTGRDVWAAGHQGDTEGTGRGRPLIIHWNGAAWRRTPVDGASWTGDLTSVAASGPGRAWATGTDADGGSHLLRWDGTRWARAPIPGAAAGATASRVYAGPGGETWLRTGGAPGGALLRRAGGTWRAVPDPPSGASVGGVRVVGRDDVWVIGSVPDGRFSDAYAAHWDGTSWTELPPYDGGFYATFIDVGAVSGDDVWAVGNACGIGTVSPIVPLLAHWDGTSWTETPLTWIPSSSGINVGRVTSLATDHRNRPVWIGIGDTYGTPPNAATYARFADGAWTEVYGPEDGWASGPRMYVAQYAAGASTYWAAGQNVRESGDGARPRIERTG